MGVRGLKGHLNRTRAWRETDLVKLAKEKGGIALLVDQCAFHYFCAERLGPGLDPVRVLSEANSGIIATKAAAMVLALRRSGVSMEFIGDAPRGLNDDDWQDRFPIWRSRFEGKLKFFEGFEQTQKRIRQLGFATGREFAFDDHNIKASVSHAVELKLRRQGELVTFARTDCDSFIRHMVQLRDSGHSGDDRIAEAGPVFGVLANDTDFCLIRGCRMVELQKFGGRDIDRRSWYPELTSLICSYVGPQEVLASLPAASSLRCLKLKDLAEVAALSGCDLTVAFQKDLEPTPFGKSVAVVEGLRPDQTGSRRIESLPFVSAACRRNPQLLEAIGKTRKFYGYEDGQDVDDCPEATKREVVEHCEGVLRCRKGLSARKALPEAQQLENYVWESVVNGEIPTAFIAVFVKGRSWDGALCQISQGPFIRDLLFPLEVMWTLALSPLVKETVRVGRDAACNVKLFRLKIPHDVAEQKCELLDGKNDHPPAYGKGRYWPSVFTLHKAPPNVRLNAFEHILRAFEAVPVGNDQEVMNYMAKALRDIPLDSSELQQLNGGGVVGAFMRIVVALNRRMTATHPHRKINSCEMENIVLTILVSFTRGFESIISQSGANPFGGSGGLTERELPALSLLLKDKTFLLTSEVRQRAVDSASRSTSFSEDALGLLSCDAIPEDHSELLVDMHCLTLSGWLQTTLETLNDMLYIFGLLKCQVVPGREPKTSVHDSALAELYSVSFFDSRIFCWLQCAAALSEQRLQGSAVGRLEVKAGVQKVEGGPIWVSERGARILECVAATRRELLEETRSQFPELYEACGDK